MLMCRTEPNKANVLCVCFSERGALCQRGRVKARSARPRRVLRFIWRNRPGRRLIFPARPVVCVDRESIVAEAVELLFLLLLFFCVFLFLHPARLSPCVTRFIMALLNASMPFLRVSSESGRWVPGKVNVPGAIYGGRP